MPPPATSRAVTSRAVTSRAVTSRAVTSRAVTSRAALACVALTVVVLAGACSKGDDTASPPATTAATTSTKAPGTTVGTTPPATTGPTTTTTSPKGPPTTPPTTGGPTGTAIRSVNFGELVLPKDSCGSVFENPPATGYPLHGGEARSGSPGDPGYYSVAVRPDPAFGDLDGNGQEDAVIVVDCSAGTTPISFAWAFAPSSAGSASRMGALSLSADKRKQLDTYGDPRLQSVSIEGPTVVTTWATHQTGDPICCPTGQATVRFTWNGAAFASS